MNFRFSHEACKANGLKTFQHGSFFLCLNRINDGFLSLQKC